MTGIRLAALPAVALALIVSLFTGFGIAAAQEEPPGRAPHDLSAATCNPAGLESVCLSWTLGADDYTYQEVWFWQTGNTAKFARGSQITPHSLSDRHIPIMLLNQIRRSIYDNGSDSFTFQVVGVKRENGNFDYSGFSNEVTLIIPRPQIQKVDAPRPTEPELTTPEPTPARPPAANEPAEPPAPDVPADDTDPSGLTAAVCGDAVCLSWTAGTGDFTYQEVRFWKTGDPDNIHFGGGRIVNTRYSEWQFTPEQMNRHPSYDGDLSYTFQVSAVKRHYGKYAYVGKSNEATLVVPAELMALAGSH